MDPRALAAALRGGDILSLSTIPQVAQMGEAQRRRAAAEGLQANRLREAAERARLQRAQQAALQTERIAAQDARAELDRGARLRAAMMRRAGTRSSGLSGYRGGFEDIGGQPVMYRFNRETGEAEYQAPTTGEWVSRVELDDLLDQRGFEMEGVRQKEGAKARGKAEEAEVVSGRESAASLGKFADTLSGAINQIGYDANTGPIASRFFSVTGPTVQFEQLQAQAGLDMLGMVSKSLAPMSDKDIERLEMASLPDTLDEDNLYYFLVHRRESLLRAREGLEFKEEFLRENGRLPSREEMEEVTHRGGFSFAAPPANETGAMLHILNVRDPETRAKFKALTLPKQREVFMRRNGPTYGRAGMANVSPP